MSQYFRCVEGFFYLLDLEVLKLSPTWRVFPLLGENFRKKLLYVCQVKAPELSTVGIAQIRPLSSDLIEKKTMIHYSFRKQHDSSKSHPEICADNLQMCCDLT